MDPLYVTLLPFAILKMAAVGLVLWWALRHPPHDGWQDGGDDGGRPPDPPAPRRPRGGRTRRTGPHGSPPRRAAFVRVEGGRAARRAAR